MCGNAYYIKYIGYIVSCERSDHRVTIEGFSVTTLRKKDEFTLDFIIDLVDQFRHADEFELFSNEARVWFT